MAKAWMYTDGKRRIDLRVSHRVTLEDLAKILVAKTWSSHEPPEMSGQEVRQAIREALASQGSDVRIDWSSDLEPDEESDALTWALEQVRRAYPELGQS